jgi:hypothetical protein
MFQLPQNPFYWNYLSFGISPLLCRITPFPLFRISPFSSFQPPLSHTPKDDGRWIGGKPPRSYSGRTDVRPTTRPITVSNPISCPVRSYHNYCRACRPKCRSPCTCQLVDAFLSNVRHLTDVPIKLCSACQHCLAQAPGSGRPVVAAHPCRARLTAIVLPVQTSELDL